MVLLGIKSRNELRMPILPIMRKDLFLLLFSILLLPSYSYGEVLSTDAIPKTAKIVDLEGEVRILKNNADDWKAAEKNAAVEIGDKIMTGASSFADIAYDDYLLNVTRIQEKTMAEFRSIDPTDIYLEDGSIFSALDGLENEGGYQIATPTAVAAVRGTHFDVAYDKSTQEFSAASLPSGDEGHQSIIHVLDPKDPSAAPVEVAENKQMNVKRGERIHTQHVRAAEPRRLEAGKKAFHHMGQRMPQFQEKRQEGKIRFEERRKQGPGQQARQSGSTPQAQMNRPSAMNSNANRPQDPKNFQGIGRPQQQPRQGEFQGPQERRQNGFQPKPMEQKDKPSFWKEGQKEQGMFNRREPMGERREPSQQKMQPQRPQGGPSQGERKNQGNQAPQRPAQRQR
jgi:hypothetical protein